MHDTAQSLHKVTRLNSPRREQRATQPTARLVHGGKGGDGGGVGTQSHEPSLSSGDAKVGVAYGQCPIEVEYLHALVHCNAIHSPRPISDRCQCEFKLVLDGCRICHTLFRDHRRRQAREGILVQIGTLIERGEFDQPICIGCERHRARGPHCHPQRPARFRHKPPGCGNERLIVERVTTVSEPRGCGSDAVRQTTKAMTD